MLKLTNFFPSTRLGRYQMGLFTDSDSEKYKVLCRSVHVTRATLYIGYSYLLLCFIFSSYFAYHYSMAVTGQISAEPWVYQYIARYIAQLFLAITIQVIIIMVMIHGVRSERKTLLIPYITFTSITVLTGCIKIISDLVYLDKTVESAEIRKSYSGSLHLYVFLSHVFGTLIQAWCLTVVWRCYGYLGEKKVDRQVREQLNATQAAFYYPDPYFYSMAQPPPYQPPVDTLIGSQQQHNSQAAAEGFQPMMK